MTIRFLTDAEYRLAPPMIQWLEPALPLQVIEARLLSMLQSGARLSGCFDDQDNCLALAAISLRTHCFSGLVAYVENVVVAPDARNQALGERLMIWIEAYAKTEGCQKVTLDAYQRNTGAQRFYQRLGYDPRGVHFVKEL